MNLAVGLMMLVTQNATTSEPLGPIIPAPHIAEAQEKISVTGPVESVVREHFSDIPMLIDIARCESHFIQFNKDGSVHRGRVNNKDVGVMQINEHYHLETSKKLGINIYTLEGNLAYGRYLYEKSGSQPWISSSPCWGKATPVALK